MLSLFFNYDIHRIEHIITVSRNIYKILIKSRIVLIRNENTQLIRNDNRKYRPERRILKIEFIVVAKAYSRKVTLIN